MGMAPSPFRPTLTDPRPPCPVGSTHKAPLARQTEPAGTCCFVQLGCRPRDRAMTGPLAALWIVALHHAAAVLGVVLILVTERVLW
jgi:hypothetical protein